MPRARTLSDEQVLDLALALIHREGPDAATFAAVSKASGLSASTLVQRFGSKASMLRAALLRAWDRLDAETARLAEECPKTPEGAVMLLAGLSKDYGSDPATYAEGLLLLREDLRDPALRARGAEWGKLLAAAIAERLKGVDGAPADIGLLAISQWQGALIWWGFDPQGSLVDHVSSHLRRFLQAVSKAR